MAILSAIPLILILHRILDWPSISPMAIALDFQDVAPSEELILENAKATVTLTQYNQVVQATGLTPHRAGGGEG